MKDLIDQGGFAQMQNNTRDQIVEELRITSVVEAEAFVRWLFRERADAVPRVEERRAIAVARLLATKVAAVHSDPDACHLAAGDICRVVLQQLEKSIATVAEAREFLTAARPALRLRGAAVDVGLLDGIEQAQLDKAEHGAGGRKLYASPSGTTISVPSEATKSSDDLSLRVAIAHCVLKSVSHPRPVRFIKDTGTESGLLRVSYAKSQHLGQRRKTGHEIARKARVSIEQLAGALVHSFLAGAKAGTRLSVDPTTNHVKEEALPVRPERKSGSGRSSRRPRTS